MNTLYLSYDGMTDPLGQAQVLPYLTGLSKKGIYFSIISFEKSEAYKNQKATISEIVKQNNISWIPLEYTKNPPFISTLYDIYKLKKVVKQEIKTRKISVIHCRSYITALVGLWAKKEYGIPFIFDMRGFWADERIDGKIWFLNNWIHKKAYHYFKKKEKEFLQDSTYSISLTYNGKEEIQSWNLPHLSPIRVIPCCTDENLFNLSTVKPIRAKLGINTDDFVISYLGSIGTWYMLDEMLDFFKELKKKKNNAKFLFITKDSKELILNTAKQKSISTDNIIIKSANRNEVPSYIKASDASIFFIKPLYSKKASSPTKMGEIMNLEVPIICNDNVGDVGEIMNKTMPELLVKNFTETEYKTIIEQLTSYQLDAKKVKDTARQYFSLENGINNYYAVYKKIKG